MPVVILDSTNTIITDTFVGQSSPTSSFGTATTIQWGNGSNGVNDKLRALLKFDLGLIPNDVIINSATLKLFNNGNTVTRQTNIHSITSAWDNNTTWNTQPSYDPTIKSSFSNYPTGQTVSIDIKTLVQEWVNGTQNLGLLMKDYDESGSGTNRSAYSSRGTYKPTLTIDYTIPITGKKQVEYVGFNATSTATSVTSTTLELPSGIQTGDLLIAQVTKRDTSTAIAGLNGWTTLSDRVIPVSSGVSFRYGIYYKFATSSETEPTLTSQTATLWTASVSAYRNTKAVRETVFSNFSTNIPNPPNATTAYDRTMLLVLSSINSFGTAKPYSLNFQKEVEAGSSATSITLFSMAKYMFNAKSIQGTDMKVEFSGTGSGEIRALFLEPINNTPPTLTLTSPTNNQTLTEGKTLIISGSATDADSGNVVTVKYKIDNGTTYNITASVSNGTTPINFSKTLTYLNNRLYDGSNPVTPILAENVTHTLTVWAEDDQGGKSPDTTRNFTVLYNQPPQISGSDQDLGTITTPPSIQYTVTDVEGYSFTITEAVDGNTIRSFPGTDGKQETLTIPHDMWIKLQPGVTHQLTITSTDQYNASSKRTFTFKRAVDGIELATTAILPADAQPTRVILSLNGTIPDGANLNVQVCNNAHDASPTWEDMSQSVKNGRPYVFTNTTSTSGQWGIRFKISILPGG